MVVGLMDWWINGLANKKITNTEYEAAYQLRKSEATKGPRSVTRLVAQAFPDVLGFRPLAGLRAGALSAASDWCSRAKFPDGLQVDNLRNTRLENVRYDSGTRRGLPARPSLSLARPHHPSSTIHHLPSITPAVFPR